MEVQFDYKPCWGCVELLDLTLAGRSLEAQEAYEWGLANLLVTCGTGKPEFYNPDQYIICKQCFLYV
jgi:hypothetical protein